MNSTSTDASALKKHDEQTFEVVVPADNAPSGDYDSIPLNHPIILSSWRKFGIMVTLAFSGFLANYGASAHLTAFGPMSVYYDRPVGDIANTIGYG
jgi:hypothetical protein